MAEFEEFTHHSVSLRTYLGAGPKGDAFSDPEVVGGLLVEFKDRLVVSSGGDQRASDTAIYDEHMRWDKFKVGSRVTVDGREREVIRRDKFEIPDMPSTVVVYLA